MAIRRILPVLVAVGLAMTDPAGADFAPTVNCPDHGVCREAGTGLPLRALPRPFSNVYRSKDDSGSGIVQANVRAFYPLYVFAREDLDASVANDPKGWYRVGTSPQGEPIGWMKAKDLLEWRQALIVSYSHPGEGDEQRGRVLMFDDQAHLKAMIESPDRKAAFAAVYAALREGRVPDGLVSKEPERFVDITERFYMLPIVDFAPVTIDGDEARYLQLAAAVPGERSEADVLANPEYRRQAMGSAELMDMEALKDLAIDLVFVMDMTASMQPYLDRTKETIAGIAREASAAIGARIRFGLVGYRDDTRVLPDLGFVSRNFTPTLVSAEALVTILDTEARAATVGAGDYQEEVFAGVKTALDSHWRDDALRFLVLVGDASSHPPTHGQNTTGMDARELALIADDARVHTLALHLKEGRATSDHALATEQFATLSQVRGKPGKSALTEIDVADRDAYARVVRDITGVVLDEIREAEQRSAKADGAAVQAAGAAPAGKARATGDRTVRAGTAELQDLPPAPAPLQDIPGPSVPTPAGGSPSGPPDPAAQAAGDMRTLMDTALVEYLGKRQKPPRDLLVWAFDRDPRNPAIPALEVRVLLTRAQLSDLVTKLDLISKALKQAELTQMAFFEALSSVAAGTVKNPEQIRNADKLKGAGLLDAFIESLPYRSEILSLSNAMYAAMTPSERAALQAGLDAKLMLYRAVNEDVDGWVRLNEEDADADKVYPLHLEALP